MVLTPALPVLLPRNANPDEGSAPIHLGEHPESISRETGGMWQNSDCSDSFGLPRCSPEPAERLEVEGEEEEGEAEEEEPRSRENVLENSSDRTRGSYGEALTDVLLPKQHPSS